MNIDVTGKRVVAIPGPYDPTPCDYAARQSSQAT